MKFSPQILALLIGTALANGNAEATLFDRGSGMIYDSDLNITWLMNANQAAGSSFDNGIDMTDGRMTWGNATAWANQLVFGGYDDWRLPTTPVPDISCDPNIPTLFCTGSEMGHLFYDELGSLADPMITNPFAQLQSDFYWSSTETNGEAWAFNFNPASGEQNKYPTDKDNVYFAWAVRNGDVATIPEPSMFALLGLGFIGLAMRRRILHS